jgi:hypothetical protein
MTPLNSFPVEYRLLQLTENVGPYGAGETWAEPSVEHAAEVMRAVVKDPAAALKRGERGRADLEAHFSPDAIAKLMRRRLNTISGLADFAKAREALETGEVPHKHLSYAELVVRIRALVASAVPPGSRVTVISKGDPDLLQLGGVTASHFPQTETGRYAGAHPADDQAAIQHLEARRLAGVDFLILPNTSFWWLDHYRGFAQHLAQNYQLQLENEFCRIFDLRESVLASSSVSDALPDTVMSTAADVEAAGNPPEPPAQETLVVSDRSNDSAIRSLEERLFDIQESLRFHAERTFDDLQRLEGRLGSIARRVDEHSATIIADAINSTRQDARVNELATLIETHARRLAELAELSGEHRQQVQKLENSNLQISELATTVASLSVQLASQSAGAKTTGDAFGSLPIYRGSVARPPGAEAPKADVPQGPIE